MKEHSTLYRYTSCGLNILSELCCPELGPYTGDGSDFDVKISIGSVSDQLMGAVYNDGFSQVRPGAYLLELGDIAKYYVFDGREIVIDPVAGCPEELIRLYLFSQCLGTLLHQRGRLILHASAIDIGQGAVVFLGQSGAGKSTLAAGFLEKGYQLLADDLSVISVSPNQQVQVFPALAQVRLWSDVLQQLDYDRHTMRKVWNKEDKYTRHITENMARRPSQLCAIYQLEPADTSIASVAILTKTKQFEILMNNVFRAEYIRGLGVGETVFKQISQMLEASEVKKLVRPRHHFSLAQIIQCVVEDIETSMGD